MNINDVISIEDIYLKILHSEDIHDTYINSLNDPKVNQFLVTVKSTFQTYSTVLEFINLNLMSTKTYFFGIWHKESNNKIIGTIKLDQHTDDISNIGICLFDQNFWNKKIGTTAISIISKWAIKKKIAKKIVAGVYLENKASMKAFSNAGYKLIRIDSCKYLLDNLPTPVAFLEYGN
jgi:RimJ/RimL family protein N-acetyltransferase